MVNGFDFMSSFLIGLAAGEPDQHASCIPCEVLDTKVEDFAVTKCSIERQAEHGGVAQISQLAQIQAIQQLMQIVSHQGWCTFHRHFIEACTAAHDPLDHLLIAQGGAIHDKVPTP
ncbi:hypothetical protein CLAM6_12810 [Cobetia sp. AM6]|nr:hypothetical protein CLAM6_12810 [Cobetia sp. AM6]